jgi:hypothetical protein
LIWKTDKRTLKKLQIRKRYNFGANLERMEIVAQPELNGSDGFFGLVKLGFPKKTGRHSACGSTGGLRF